MNKAYSEDVGVIPLVHRAIVGTTSGSANTAARLNPPVVTATSLTRSGTTATFTATAAHRLNDGQKVTISGATGANAEIWNRTFRITVTSSTVFTFTLAVDPGADAAGTILAKYSPIARWAVFHADAANAADISIGPDVNADMRPVPAGDFYTIKSSPDDVFNLGNWYAKSTSASQAFTILFI